MPPATPTDLATRVARRISARRREMGLSQEGLAALLDIAVKNVQRIESGKQNLSLATLERIAAALEIAPEPLIAGIASKPGPSTLPTLLDRLARAGYEVRRATERGRRPASAIPITTLRAAAGRLEGTARAVETLGWLVLSRKGAAPEGQFAAEVSGASMAPAIPPGAVCLFGRPSPPLTGRIVLVAHETLADDELGGPYAIKRIGTVKTLRDGRIRVVLESINRSFAPMTILTTPDELRVVAELVRVLVR